MSWDMFLEIIDQENNLNNNLMELKINGFSTKRYKEGEKKIIRVQEQHPNFRTLQIEKILGWCPQRRKEGKEFYFILFDNDKVNFFQDRLLKDFFF